MKKRQFIGKLSLTRETLRKLTDSDLSQAGGGGAKTSGGPASVFPNCNCTNNQSSCNQCLETVSCPV